MERYTRSDGDRNPYTPVVGPTDRTVTLPALGIMLLPCPNEGPGERCASCETECVFREYLRQREGA